MPYTVIGREVVRGTITRDRWRAEVTLACNDRVPLNSRTDLFLNILWRSEEPDAPTQPDDAAPIVLRMKPLTPEAGGAIRFDHPDGPTEKQFSGNTTTILSLYGKSASAGEIADIALEVDIEGKTRGTLKLSVGTVSKRLDIRAGNGSSDPPMLLTAGQASSYQAIVRGMTVRGTTAPAGAFGWRAFQPDKLTIVEGSSTNRVTVVATADTDAQRFLLAWFTETPPSTEQLEATSEAISTTTLAAVLPIATFTEQINANLNSDIEPDAAEIIRAGWATELANPGDTAILRVETSGGQVGQKLSIEIQTVTAAGDGLFLETIEAPLGGENFVEIPWQVPAAIAEGAPEALSFTASLLDQAIASADHPQTNRTPSPLYAQLRLQTFLEIQLIDSNNNPLANVTYQLTDREGTPIDGASGQTGPDGEILIPDLPSTEYILQVNGITVFSASEPELPTLPPAPDNTVFSFLDVRLDGRAAATTSAEGGSQS